MWHVGTWMRGGRKKTGAFAMCALFMCALLPLVATVMLSASTSALAQSRPVVVELFTSQGCSSCPAADALFESYAKRSDIIALSYSVHYWDYLGWKDTLASARFTERQKAYAKGRGDGQVYTPQIVVEGRKHAVGSDKSAIESALKHTAKHDVAVALKLSRSSAGTRLELPAVEAWKGDANIWLATVTRRVEVMVTRGENAGRSLTYFNVVRSLNKVAQYQGQPLSLTLDQSAIDQSETDQLVALVQVGYAGPIVGAATLAMKP